MIDWTKPVRTKCGKSVRKIKEMFKKNRLYGVRRNFYGLSRRVTVSAKPLKTEVQTDYLVGASSPASESSTRFLLWSSNDD